jgi:uracil-DNA glycosylase
MDERDELLADLRERARYYASLTDIGLPRRPASPAATPMATTPAAPVAAPVPVAAGPTAPAPGLVTAAEDGGAAIAPPSSATSTANPADELRAVSDWVGDCQRCKLAPTRRNIVLGQGSPTARLMFVGEAPGADEDEQGLAFVGKAGQLLTKIIEAIGLKREDVWIGNVLKCLKYSTLVQLEDGSWERIGRLVAARYGGRVMSVDEAGRLVPKRVTAWHRSALDGRRVFKLSYRSSRRGVRDRAVTWLTHDHEVLTRRGWVHAACLRDNDLVAVGQGLSRVASDVVAGSLLGDGTINRTTACLALVHSRKQQEYVRLKARALRELAPQVGDGESAAIPGGRKYPTVVCRTRASRALRVVRRRFYPDGRKIVPRDLRLSAMSFSIWFLDDGYTKVESDACATAEIACHSFDPDEIEYLLYALYRDLGLEAYTRPSAPARIQFAAEGTLELSNLVAPFCPPSMRYKLHPAAASRFPFDPGLYEAGPAETLYDEVVVEPAPVDRPNPRFFCIDVEDTHNFVTSGGVVHNCRPPQNRNPEPDEILSCQPFLERQIAAIRPKVIVGLGKFAGQWLLKTAEPISRIRGRVGDYDGVKVVPTYHPAYLLRNPGAKKEVWEDMKLVRSLLQD